MPDSVTSIGDGAFDGCDSLRYNEDNNACYLGNTNNPYLCLIKAKSTNISSCTINDNCKFIYDGAFDEHYSLTSIIIPDSVTSIGDYAFYRCCNLTSINIPDSVISIGNYAFYLCCNKLTSINIPDRVTSIGKYAFYACSSLESVTIGNSVTSIKSSAFEGCNSLKNIYYNGDINSWVQIDGLYNLMKYGKSSKNLYINEELLTKVNITTATKINSYAFCETSITSVTIGDSVTSIGEDAFYNCSKLTSIVIPDSVTNIGNFAFYNCSSLTSVTIGDSVTSIGDYAFHNCSSLTSITIPDRVTSINHHAFSGCSSLRSVTIGNGVNSIGDYAFENCSSVTSVYYKGGKEEWYKISIASANYKLTSAKRYYYSETQPTTSGNYWHYTENGEIAVW